jgi:hypothetical protein
MVPWHERSRNGSAKQSTFLASHDGAGPNVHAGWHESLNAPQRKLPRDIRVRW